MNKERLLYLIRQYRENRCTPIEQKELYELISESGVEESILQVWDQLHGPTVTSLSEGDGKRLYQKIIGSPSVQKDLRYPIKFKTRFKYLTAAAAVLAVLCGAYALLFFKSPKTTAEYAVQQVDTTIVPGSKKAQIIFEDGRAVNLAELSPVDTIHTGNYFVLKQGGGEVSYHNNESIADRSIETYNILVTPLGGEYAVILADGTKVWLNANSKLKYPTRFTTTQRTVELEGEAYFEVARMKKEGKRIPFYVKSRSQTVAVLGTEFNINSFGDQITTTLVEGKVALTHHSQSAKHLLAPNDQIIYKENTHTYEKKKVDPYYFTAWKDGAFAFDNTPLTLVMEDIARWYNVQIDYESDVSDVYFSGKISKMENIKTLLQTIQWTGSVKFKINGRRIAVREY
ncbi:FecR domain-containing protein [Pedobacter sp. ASV1-7]|uniref:FecR family protein n=1 Tax=Pedobacter sp. ASV1-7 TaxID=3145237 RepID=UPI0032E89F6F